jgi:hypothetical protein
VKMNSWIRSKGDLIVGVATCSNISTWHCEDDLFNWHLCLMRPASRIAGDRKKNPVTNHRTARDVGESCVGRWRQQCSELTSLYTGYQFTSSILFFSNLGFSSSAKFTVTAGFSCLGERFFVDRSR